MVVYQIYYTKQAQKDAKKIVKSGLKDKVQKILEILEIDPYQKYPPFEKLIGDLHGAFSRRINIQHRLVYQIIDDKKAVKILRMYTHYGEN
jgi:Txe/YoeB family toxin of toxin-antitoxin system